VPRTKIKVPPERWRTVRIHEVYYNELVEICKYLELSLPTCLGHLIHEAYVQLDVERREIEQEKEDEVKEQVKRIVEPIKKSSKAERRIPPPP
jgi:hypothetical protein